MTKTSLPVSRASEILKEGGLVIVPTETVYGIAVDAMNADAVERLYEIKGRDPDKPLSVQVPDVDTAFQWTKENSTARLLASLWPGPLTIVMPHSGKIPRWITPTAFVGFRIPDHPVMLEILRSVNIPLAVPSANFSGKPAPTSVDALDPDLIGLVDGIVNGGPCRLAKESTVVRVNESSVKILREGAVNRETIARLGVKIDA